MEQTSMEIKQINEELIALRSEIEKIKQIVGEDLEFISDTKEAIKDLDEGNFKRMSQKEFFNEIKSLQ